MSIVTVFAEQPAESMANAVKQPQVIPSPDLLKSLGIQLPAQPWVLQQIQTLADMDELDDIRKLAKIIAEDPGITARLFKLARSGAYSRGRRLESLEQVLQVVGITQTLNLIRALALQDPGAKPNPIIDAFWKRSRAISEYAACIAEDRITVCNIFPDQAFLAGTFLDCGVPILMRRFPDYGQVQLTPQGDVMQWANPREEDSRYSTDHAVLGYWVARNWGLPDFVANTILCHHEMGKLGEDHKARTMVAMILLAAYMYAQEHGEKLHDWHIARGKVLEELGLHEDELAEFCEEIKDRVVDRRANS